MPKLKTPVTLTGLHLQSDHFCNSWGVLIFLYTIPSLFFPKAIKKNPKSILAFTHPLRYFFPHKIIFDNDTYILHHTEYR